MAYPSDQERYFHSVLDRNIHLLSPQKLRHSPAPSFIDSPSIITKASVSFVESQSIHSDIVALREKVAWMESCLERPGMLQTFSPLFYGGKSEQTTGKDSERRKTGVSGGGLSMDANGLKGMLVEERRKQVEIRRENDRLRQRLGQNKGGVAKLAALRRDVDALRTSYHKSEEIRLKQKQLIDQLRGS